MKHPILFIHGANSSSTSFAFIETFFPDRGKIKYEWDINAAPLTDIVKALERRVAHVDQRYHIVAHSYGGILGMNVAWSFPADVISITTLATPFEGVELPLAVRLLNWHDQLIRNTSRFQPCLKRAQKRPPNVPHMLVQTTAGHLNLLGEANDGVVSIKSQFHQDASMLCVAAVNHFEVLLDDVTAAMIKEFITDVEDGSYK